MQPRQICPCAYQIKRHAVILSTGRIAPSFLTSVLHGGELYDHMSNVQKGTVCTPPFAVLASQFLQSLVYLIPCSWFCGSLDRDSDANWPESNSIATTNITPYETACPWVRIHDVCPLRPGLYMASVTGYFWARVPPVTRLYLDTEASCGLNRSLSLLLPSTRHLFDVTMSSA
jgi:hypothetical protein